MTIRDIVPRHVAIIMDGNGRWAKERGLPRTEGHRQGIKRVREILRTASEAGVKYLTLFAFSSENWKRPKTEIQMLMRSLDNFLNQNLKELIDNNIRLNVLGRKEPIPDYLWKNLNKVQDQTRKNNGLVVNLAFNYGARQEIVDAVNKVVKDSLDKKIDLEDINVDNFGSFLYTAGIPDPDLLIRTSGEMRLSNFLLWQLSYAELYFVRICWPEFKKDNFLEALQEYGRRTRRFGGI